MEKKENTHHFLSVLLKWTFSPANYPHWCYRHLFLISIIHSMWWKQVLKTSGHWNPLKKLQRLKRNSWFCYIPEWCFCGTPPKSPSEKENQTKTAKQEGFFHSQVPCSTSSSCTGNLDTASGHDCEAVNGWQNKSLDVAAVTGQVILVFMSVQIISQLFVGAFLLLLKCPVLFRMTCRFIHTGKFIKVCAEVFQFSSLNENNSE